MKLATIAAAAVALTSLPTAAMAQDAAAPAPSAAPASVNIAEGASVMGNDGVAIGTVTQVTPEAVVVDTGANEIPLPRDAFGQDEKGLTLNITKAALDASYQEQMAALEAQVTEKLVAGTPVTTADMQPLGTVDMINGENVVLALADEKKLTLGKNVFTVDGAGSLMVRATKAQIDQAMANMPAPEQG